MNLHNIPTDHMSFAMSDPTATGGHHLRNRADAHPLVSASRDWKGLVIVGFLLALMVLA